MDLEEDLIDQLENDEPNVKHNEFPLFQKNKVKSFIDQHCPNMQANLAFREKFNRSLTLFVLYLYHIMKLNQGDKKKKITKNDIVAALKSMNMMEIAEQLEQNPFPIVEQVQEQVQQEFQVID